MPQLVSPGISITVSDESFYAGADQGTVPLIVIATRSNKANPNDTDFSVVSSIAPGTIPAVAGVNTLITSQRELIQTFGEPIFVEEAGTPSHGNELNEYGLHAAMQYLGISDRAYVIRADVPLEELEPRDIQPVGPPINGTYWLDLTRTMFGIFQGDLTQWNSITPLLLNLNIPALDNSVVDAQGANGDFAIDIGNNLLGLIEKIAGTWYRVGSPDWVTAKGSTNLVGGGTGPATISYTPHTGGIGNILPVYHDQHVWVKTTTPNLGADYYVNLYNSTTALFTQIFCPMFTDEAAANTFYGATLVGGSLFVDYDAAVGTHLIKRWDGTNWIALVYEANLVAPTTEAVEDVLWYNSSFLVDLMVSDGSNWLGYLNRYATTDPNGVLLSGTAPITQSDATALVDNDLWIDTTDLENYPKLYRWVVATLEWVLVDNTDQTTNSGIVFGDAREIGGPGGIDAIPGLTSNLVDGDTPDPLLYPAGMLLFNTRFSSLNVKTWKNTHTVDAVPVGGAGTSNTATSDRWVSESGLLPDGSPYMGRKAQRRIIVQAIQSVFASNEEVRSEFIFYNLIAAPGYPDVIDEMITLNVDIKEIAFIVGDTPARLAPTGSALQNYATNAAGSPLNGEEGRTAAVAGPYVGQWYPWGLSTNLDGTEIMVPPSTVALRTIAYNDQVSYPWSAPAGFQRGLVSNAQSVGYLTAENEFEQIILNAGQQEVLSLNKINPIVVKPNRGLVIFGQKTLNPVASALDRINVARLINYIRYNLDLLVQPFLFEPNDSETRDSVQVTVERFLGDLLGKRALYDFGVRVDTTNNTPDRIDKNELWVDVAIKPTKTVEFIYIPIRILNTGDSI
jgi:hypothetical protein